jgi:hypothetical protein
MSDGDVMSDGRAGADALLKDAHEALRCEDLESALDLFQVASQLDPDRFEIEGYVELVRSRLLKRYRERIGELQAVPKLLVDEGQVRRFNLAPDAGFMLSLVDGSTSFEQLVSLSGMAAFEAFRNLCALLDAGILGVDA